MKKYDETFQVLLIDDNKEEYYIVREFISEISSIKLNLDWASSYEEAIEKVGIKRYDVFLIDYNLGAYTGVDLLVKINQIVKTNYITIFLTAEGNKSLDERVLKNAMDDYLSKDDLNASLLGRSIRYGIERKRTIIELAKSEEMYKQLYANSKTPVMHVDKDCNVVEINEAFKVTFKFKPEFKLNADNTFKVWQILECTNYKDELIHHILNVRDKVAVTFRCKTQEDDPLELQLHVYEIEGSNAEISYQVVIVDLTEEIKRSQEERQRTKLDLMEKMARIVAHEVRNPLNNIVLAEGQLSPEIDKELLLYTDIIKRNADKIEDLIRKFLNTFNTVVIKHQEVELREVLMECVNEFMDTSKLMNVKLVLDCDHCDVKLSMDKERVALVFNNLIKNAMKACEHKVNTQITISVELTDAMVEIRIKDNGKGLGGEDMSQLFEPFYTNSGNGLGLGLTTSLNIIKSHHGDIKAAQNNLGGATFTVILPKKPGIA